MHRKTLLTLAIGSALAIGPPALLADDGRSGPDIRAQGWGQGHWDGWRDRGDFRSGSFGFRQVLRDASPDDRREIIGDIREIRRDGRAVAAAWDERRDDQRALRVAARSGDRDDFRDAQREFRESNAALRDARQELREDRRELRGDVRDLRRDFRDDRRDFRDDRRDGDRHHAFRDRDRDRDHHQKVADRHDRHDGKPDWKRDGRDHHAARHLDSRDKGGLTSARFDASAKTQVKR